MSESIFNKHLVLKLFLCLFVMQSGFSPRKISARQPVIEYSHKRYTIHDGLTQMQVMSLFQDSKGYLWCLTKAGICRFDGRNFKTIKFKIPELGGYGNTYFGEDSKGNILFFAESQFSVIMEDTICQYLYPEGYRRSVALKQSILKPLIELEEVHNDRSNSHVILNCENQDSISFLNIKMEYGPILCFDERNAELIWQANSDSIYITNLSARKVVNSFSIPEPLHQILFGRNDIYAISQKHTLFKIIGNQFELISKLNVQGINLKAVVTPDQDGFVIKTSENLYLYQDSLSLIKGNMTFIRDILYDDEYNLWVATEEGLYNFFQLNFTNYTFGMGNKDWIWSVLEDGNNDMWFASYQNGIWKWDGRKITDYTGLANSGIDRQTKLKPPKYRYYMGASKIGATLYFPTECNVLSFDGKNFEPVQGISERPYQITKAQADGTLLCGGYPGLYQINPNGEIKFWSRNSLRISSVLNVELDKYGQLVAIGSKEITVIGKDSLMYFDEIQYQNRYCCTKDYKGNIWIGGSSNLNMFDGDSFQTINCDIHETFFSILFVEPEYLLLGGLNGLFLANLGEFYKNGILETKLFNQHNGFTGIECGQNGFFLDSDGYVWITTSDLVTRFNPKKIINHKVNPPKFYIKPEVSIDNINWQNCNLKNEKPFKYFQNNFRFILETVSFANLGKIRYYYCLKGLQNDWSDLTYSNEFTFYNLKPGIYSFWVKADPGVSHAISDVLILDFEIAKPFWLRWWFILSTIMLFCVIVFAVIKQIKLREQQKAIINQRIIQLRSDALAAQLDPHFVMNCLNSVGGLVYAGYTEKANDYIVKFSKLLRIILENIKKDLVCLSVELEMVTSYIELERFRYDNNFSYNITLPGNYSAQNIKVPPMILQPLVENSIKHGFSGMKKENGHIDIIIQARGDKLQIYIRDNGKGFDSNSMTGTGAGTRITKERIQLLQTKHNIDFRMNNTFNGFEVSFTIPLIISPLN
ncbi:MAG: histidine kinase [Prolixibacteraceae bacterium]|nr:histidine kinase [Prolixibacteraceae bacterium]